MNDGIDDGGGGKQLAECGTAMRADARSGTDEPT